MEELINIIDEITKYGLKPDLKIDESEKELEKNLVKFYSKSFEINYQFDNTDYPEFDKSTLPDIRENVIKNFPEFGWYHSVFDCHKIIEDADLVTGDSIDDLSDIIYDLLEIKWRFENNGERDALWFFELIFYSHTQQHLISLLNYLKHKNG